MRNARHAAMNLSLTLQSIARRWPDRPAITSDRETIDYAAFEQQAAAIAGALRRRHGLSPGKRIGIVMENCPEYFPVLYGAWRAGLAAVPINAKLHPKELAWILADSEARLVIATPELAEAMTAEAGESWPTIIATGTRDYAELLRGEPVFSVAGGPEHEAWLFYTSGTTGRPKGAVLTHRNLLFMVHAYTADIDFLGPEDTMLHAAPLSHGSGLYGLAHIAHGSNNVIPGGSFDAGRVFDTFARFRNVSMFAAPTMVVRLLNHPHAGVAGSRGLKTLIYGGAPMYVADLKQAIERFGPRFFQVYGQGETPMTISGLDKAAHADSSHPDYEARLGSAGVARTGVAFRIVDEKGRDLPVGEVGEIITKSDCVMQGYWRNPEANANALREGWLWTGDLGSVDAAGFLTLKDRSKDLIISGGANIYPREVEEVLLRHPDVIECAVVGRPHPEWGEVVVAFVVTRPDGGATAKELDALCLANIARFKRPKHYRFVESLPKNNYGKVLKTELRKLD
jgi:long-chain acyl-CoA synthetase